MGGSAKVVLTVETALSNCTISKSTGCTHVYTCNLREDACSKSGERRLGYGRSEKEKGSIEEICTGGLSQFHVKNSSRSEKDGRHRRLGKWVKLFILRKLLIKQLPLCCCYRRIVVNPVRCASNPFLHARSPRVHAIPTMLPVNRMPREV